MASFAQHESKLSPYAIHENASGPSVYRETAAATTVRLNRGHNLDLGIMQLNSASMARTGLTVVTAFDAGPFIRADGQIIVAAYGQYLCGKVAPTPDDQQAALRCAALIYNTNASRPAS